jgi:hypothetical protein
VIPPLVINRATQISDLIEKQKIEVNNYKSVSNSDNKNYYIGDKLNTLTMNKSNKILIAIIALSAWFALILQLYILIHNTPDNGMTMLAAVGRFLIFFTILTNILVAVCVSILLVRSRSAAGRFFSKSSVIAAVALYIFIVGLVYNIILRGVWHPQGLQKLADELLHVAVPLLFIIYWLLFASKNNLQWMDAFKWLLYPAVYLLYAMVRGGIEGFYPYPFINANELPFGRVFMNSFGLLIVFIISGFLFIAISRWLSRQTNDGKDS